MRVYNQTLLYGVYLLPVYIVSLGLIVLLTVVFAQGVKTGKIRFKPKKKVYSYTDSQGKRVYFKKNTEKK